MAGSQRERAVRSDSARNRDAIMDAAVRCLATNPSASLADIATAAGIGRVTLYGHFSSRAELLTAVLHRTMAQVESEMASVDLEGDTWQAMERLVSSSWQLLDSLNGLLGAVELTLPEDDVRRSHNLPMARVRALLDKGRADGTFRDDLSVEWQTSCYFALLHGAASEIRSGRLTQAEVQRVLPETVRALLRPAA